jgi:transcriptional regulator with XRE-family HTH domain
MNKKVEKTEVKSGNGNELPFGKRLAEARRIAGLTQQELADKAGVHISHVQRIEAGTSQPTVDVLKRLAEALTVSIDMLVFSKLSEEARARISDAELLEQFTAIETFADTDKQALKTIISAMIVKHRVELAVR